MGPGHAELVRHVLRQHAVQPRIERVPVRRDERRQTGRRDLPGAGIFRQIGPQVAAGQRMVRLQLMIDASRRLIVDVDRRRRASQRSERHGEGLSVSREIGGLARGSLCGREEFEQRLHLRAAADSRLQDLTAGFCRRAVERESRPQLPVGPPLERSEEERPVSQDRAPECPAELPFFPERRLDRSGELFVQMGALVQIVRCVQALVVDERECGPLEHVRPVPGDHVDDGAGGAAELRRELIGDEPHFLDGVRVIELLLPAGDARIVAVLAVDHEVVRAQAHAVRREVRS